MSIRHSEKLINEFRRKKILVLGDVMLDRFIWGNVTRISPEAPVPVVLMDRELICPGGAANVARNLVPFAGNVHMSGLIGEDKDGSMLSNILEEGGIETAGMLRKAGFGTITKTRIIAHQQQVVRIDREKVTTITGTQVQQVKRFISDRVHSIDGLIIEDYGKGFVSQELVDEVVPIAQAAGVVVTVDPNPTNRLNWQGVTAVKPNRSEAFQEAGVATEDCHSRDDPASDEILLKVGNELLNRWGARMVQVTLGEQGMMLFERGEPPHHIPTKAKDVFDVSGAGDTAIALFTLALTAGATPVEAAEISNYASGVVVGKFGTATLTSDELMESIRRSENSC